MNTTAKIVIIIVLLAAIGGVIAVKINASHRLGADANAAAAPSVDPAPPQPAKALPQLIDLGATTCIPCKAMAPILEQLKHDFDGRFGVTFIDVWQEPAAGEAYGVQLIPTQIFFDAQGKELFRHVGFFSREQILATWKDLGFDFEPPAETSP